jgi:hypothetical protein
MPSTPQPTTRICAPCRQTPNRHQYLSHINVLLATGYQSWQARLCCFALMQRDYKRIGSIDPGDTLMSAATRQSSAKVDFRLYFLNFQVTEPYRRVTKSLSLIAVGATFVTANGINLQKNSHFCPRIWQG